MPYGRSDGRAATEYRPVSVAFNAFGYAASSVLFTQGNTKVLCSVTLQSGVPPFLRGKGTGWLTAEYSMLPTSTHDRSAREITMMARSGRSSEISRFISRALRTVVNLATLGERTIMIDCDVLQADGGTRTACVTAASLALMSAQAKWLQQGVITQACIVDSVVALSVGIKDQMVLLDPNYAEDSKLGADFNVVLTQSGALVELQGSAEKGAVPWQFIDTVLTVARDGIRSLCKELDQYYVAGKTPVIDRSGESKSPLFSLQNRMKSPL